MFPQPLIALWTVHPGDLLGEPIQFLTHGPVTHAGFLRSDGVTIHENYLPHVRNRPVKETEKVCIRLFRLEGMDDDSATVGRFERFFDLAASPQFAAEYSIKGLFGYLFNVPDSDEQSSFCSQYVMQTIRKVTPELLPLARCENFQVSPRDLLISPRLIEVHWGDLNNQAA